MSRAYTSYTTIRCGACGNRKMAERIELIFTMETDSPVLDGIMGVQIPKDEGLTDCHSYLRGAKYDVFAFACQRMCLSPS